jgi:hypothetical protein
MMARMTSASDEPLVTPQGAQTAWCVVIEPGSACNHYRWDEARGALILERVERSTEARGADLARAPLLGIAGGERDDALLAGSGPGLLTLVLSAPANPRGTWLEARVLGAFRVKNRREGFTGASDASPADYIALAVPVADAALANIVSIETLTPGLRERAQRALLAIAPDAAARIYQGLYEPETLGSGASGWLDGAATMTLYRAARVAASRAAEERRRMAVAADTERLTTDAEAAGEALLRRLEREASAGENKGGEWRGLAGVNLAELRARGAAVFGEPEDLLRWMPSRFARYLGELLTADERALFFAAAPALTLRGWNEAAPRRGGGGWLAGRLFSGRASRRLHEGLLLVTDRQVMLLRDYAPANGVGTQLGFLARSWPLGRLVAVGVAHAGSSLDEAMRGWPERVTARLCPPQPLDEALAAPEQTARLALALEGAAGIQLTGVAFPPEAAPQLERAAGLLHGFTPLLGAAGGGDWRLRRLPTVTAWRPTEREARELESLGGMVAPAVARTLLEETQRTLAPEEMILAQGRTPSLAESGADIPALLTLTPRHLLLASAASGGAARMRTLPLGELTSVTLSYSLMGSWLAVARPLMDPRPVCEEIRVAFPSPLIAPFRALGNRVRALLEAGPALERSLP